MKFSESKIMIYLEKVYYLILINTMIILGSMLFITFLNSLSAGLYSLRIYTKNDDQQVIRNFFNKFMDISYKGVYSNIIVYLWFWMLYSYLPLIKGQQISGLIIYYLISIELIIFTIGLIKVFSSKEIGSVIQNTKKALLIGHIELPSVILYFISILSSLLILYKIRLLIPLFIVGPYYLFIIIDSKVSKLRS